MLKLLSRFTWVCLLFLLSTLLLVSFGSTNQAAATVVANKSNNFTNNKAEIGTPNTWNGWGHDYLNTRFNPSTAINAHNVTNLTLKWAFVFPDATSASSQPTVVANTLYVGGWNGKFYALDTHNGKELWSFDTASFTGPLTGYPPGFSDAVRDAPVVGNGKVYFGDLIGNFYALNASTGNLVWAEKLDNFPFARITSSPILWNNRIYVGIASGEEGFTANPSYPCCTFRGSVVALDSATGALIWRYYTISQPAQQTGVSSTGTPLYGPSGVAVWSSPALDPDSRTLYIATGNNYSLPTTNREDSIIALDATNGQERWAVQMTPNDRWNVDCTPQSIGLPPGAGPNCPPPNTSDNDFDFGYSPNIFFAQINGQVRELVGVGQKSGIYHVLDAHTGELVWQRQLSIGTVAGGIGGIQWGGSWDGSYLYIATHVANPGTLFALDPATGKIVWSNPNPADGCSTGGAANYQTLCQLALPAAVTTVPGVAFEGSWDGKFRAYNTKNGNLLWSYDTIQSFTDVNGNTGHGGSINGGGAVVVNNTVYVNSGYEPFPGASIPGNVLLAFSL